MQLSFSTLWDGYKTDKEALNARNAKAKELKIKGYKVNRFTLKNQQKKYDGFGMPNGSICDVYMLDYQERTIPIE